MKTTYQEESGGVEDSMVLHTKIYEAIRSHDMQTAREAMAAHTSGIPLLTAVDKTAGWLSTLLS